MEERQVLKDSTSINHQKPTVILRYKESLEEEKISDHIQNQKIVKLKNEKNREDKENNLAEERKVKLKLKTNSSKELSSKESFEKQTKKQKEQKEFKINQINSGPKTTTTQREIQKSEKPKEKKINSYFKPSVIYFSLKSKPENEKLIVEVTKSPKLKTINEPSQESKKKIDYSLSAFISEFVNRTCHMFLEKTSIINEKDVIEKVTFSYSEFVEILHSLEMIRYPSEKDYKIEVEEQKEEIQKIYFLWRIFKANVLTSTDSIGLEHKNVFFFTLANFIILLSAILRYNVENVEDVYETFCEKFQNFTEKGGSYMKENHTIEKLSEPSQIFFIKNKKLLNPQPKIVSRGLSFINLTEEARGEIFKEFEIFRINRLNSKNLQKKPKLDDINYNSENENEEFDFASIISPKSKELALTRRIRILEELREIEMENNQENQKEEENYLNIFLSYKSPKNCEKKLQKNLQLNVNSENKNEKDSALQTKKERKKQKIQIESPKIKYSELTIVKNMEKARKLKQEKQLIFEKGWTNNGHLAEELSKEKQRTTIEKRISEEKKTLLNPLNGKENNKNGSATTLSYFEKRKNSFRGMKILEEKLRNQEKIHEKDENSAMKGKDKYLLDYEDLFENDENNEKEEIQREVEILDDISNSTIPMKENDGFDLEDDYDDQFGEDVEDFVLENHFGLEGDELKSKELKPAQQNEENTIESDAQSFERVKKEEGAIGEFNFKSKTFATQENQFVEDDDVSEIKTKTLTKNQEARVIKSYLKIPILYVDVNMDDAKKERIIIYEEDDPSDLAKEFGHKHKLGKQMIERLEEMLKEQIGGILGRIDEEDDENDETHEEIVHNN